MQRRTILTLIMKIIHPPRNDISHIAIHAKVYCKSSQLAKEKTDFQTIASAAVEIFKAKMESKILYFLD